MRNRRTFGCATASPGAASRRCRCSTIWQAWFARGEAQSAKLGEFDVILMRKDPPFDTEYIYTTYILDRAAGPGRAGVQPAAGSAGHEREGVHGLVSRVLRAHAHHPRHARHGRIPARARQSRVQAPGWHGGQVHFRAGTGRQEPQCRVRIPDRLRHPIRHRAALSAGNRHRRRLPDHSGGRRAGALRPEADARRPTTTAAIWPPARAPRAVRSTSATDGCARRSDPNSRRPE